MKDFEAAVTEPDTDKGDSDDSPGFDGREKLKCATTTATAARGPYNH